MVFADKGTKALNQCKGCHVRSNCCVPKNLGSNPLALGVHRLYVLRYKFLLISGVLDAQGWTFFLKFFFWKVRSVCVACGAFSVLFFFSWLPAPFLDILVPLKKHRLVASFFFLVRRISAGRGRGGLGEPNHGGRGGAPGGRGGPHGGPGVMGPAGPGVMGPVVGGGGRGPGGPLLMGPGPAGGGPMGAGMGGRGGRDGPGGQMGGPRGMDMGPGDGMEVEGRPVGMGGRGGGGGMSHHGGRGGGSWDEYGQGAYQRFHTCGQGFRSLL